MLAKLLNLRQNSWSAQMSWVTPSMNGGFMANSNARDNHTAAGRCGTSQDGHKDGQSLWLFG